MSDLAAVGAAQFAELEQDAAGLAARGVDAELVRSAVRVLEARSARGPLRALAEHLQSRFGPDDPSLAPVAELLGFCTAEPEVTIAWWSRAVAIRTGTVGPVDRRTTNVRFVLALFHHQRGDPASAVPILEPVLAACDDGSAGEDDRLDQSLGLLGSCARRIGRADLAERAFRTGLHRARAAGWDGDRLASCLGNLGGLLAVLGRAAEARPLLEESLHIARDHPDRVTPGWISNLAAGLYEIDEVGSAEVAFQLGHQRGLVRERPFPRPGELPPLIFDLPERWKQRTGNRFDHVAKPQYNLLLSVSASDAPPVESADGFVRRVLAGNPTVREPRIDVLPGGRALAGYRSSMRDPTDPRPKDDRHWVLIECTPVRTLIGLVTLSVLRDEADADETERLVAELTRSLSAAHYNVGCIG